jgi:hypothetical protein
MMIPVIYSFVYEVTYTRQVQFSLPFSFEKGKELNLPNHSLICIVLGFELFEF